MEEIKTRYEITEFRKDDSDFFSHCQDIIKNIDGSYRFEPAAWIENGYLCSYHSTEELFNPEKEYNRNCAICSHATYGGKGLFGDKHNCEIASRLNRQRQATIDFCKENDIDLENLCTSVRYIIGCDAYDEINELNLIRNMKEMVDFIDKTFNMLGDWDGVCNYYGFEIPYDWDNDKAECTIYEYYKNGGKFDYIPEENEFPVVVYFDYETDNPYRNHLKWMSMKGKL